MGTACKKQKNDAFFAYSRDGVRYSGCSDSGEQEMRRSPHAVTKAGLDTASLSMAMCRDAGHQGPGECFDQAGRRCGRVDQTPMISINRHIAAA